VKRREFITLLGGAAASWPVVARGQQSQPMRRIGALVNVASVDQAISARFPAFRQALQQLGWTEGVNVQTDYRVADGNPDRLRAYANELVALRPDVILASGSTSLAVLQQATRSVPIVFANVVDPIGGGFVNNLARPGGNVTGFTPFEYSLSSKWLELLKEIVPRVTRVAVIRDPANPSGIGQFAAIRTVAPSLGVELTPIDVRDAAEIEHGLAAFARSPNDGLIVTSAGSVAHLTLIPKLASKHRLPAIYANRSFVTGGGLISYGPDLVEGFRLAASYVDRILKGEKPGDLPVQSSDKFELTINLKSAKELGLSIPLPLLGRANEVIE
jgi:putative ABC transport system substrate-binding protein